LSRRFGRSLGVDLVRPKTCSLSCIFCQLGPTAATTNERHADVPMDEIIAELKLWQQTGDSTDFVTLGGSGEPTLHPQFGDLLRWIRDNMPFRSLLLSNGTLFSMESVRRDAALADAVKVSLHAWDQASFEQMTCPHPSLRLNAIVDGYLRFREIFHGSLYLEVFVVPGINDHPEQMAKVAGLAARFRPDVIQLNTLDRPPADAAIQVCPPETLARLASLFTPAAELPRQVAPEPRTEQIADADALVALVCRHPASVDALAAQSSRTIEATLALLKALASQQRIRLFKRDAVWFAGPP